MDIGKIIKLMLIYLILTGIGLIAVFFLKDKIAKNSQIKGQNNSKITFTNEFTYYDTSDGIKHELYKQHTKVKGVFVNSSAINSRQRFSNLIQLADNTEVNAFVIDVKEDGGRITFDMDIPMVKEIGSSLDIIDIKSVMDKMYEHNIFPIARIVCFKDPFLAKNKTKYAIKNKDGSLWHYKDIAWLNPYNRESWEYIVNIAKEASKVGFKEIQFDYIRFEATKSLNNAELGQDSNDIPRTKIITDFIEYAKKELYMFH